VPLLELSPPVLLLLEPVSLLELELSLVLSSTPVLELPVLEPTPVSVAGGGGSLVSAGGSPVVPGGGVPVLSLVPVVGSVSVAGTAHSPMHTGSGSPHAKADERRTSPRAATLLRFMWMSLVANAHRRPRRCEGARERRPDPAREQISAREQITAG
jgi:hypothetical protein